MKRIWIYLPPGLDQALENFWAGDFEVDLHM